jgi:hypothetical protein
MSRYLNQDRLLDLSSVPRVFPVLIYDLVTTYGLAGLEIGQKTTSDKFAYAIALEVAMTGKMPVEADICLLEPNGWKSYDFSFQEDESQSWVDVRKHIPWSDGEQPDGIFGIEWTQIKFDRWIRFPVIDFGQREFEPEKYAQVMSFYLEAQSCRFYKREVS